LVRVVRDLGGNAGSSHLDDVRANCMTRKELPLESQATDGKERVTERPHSHAEAERRPDSPPVPVREVMLRKASRLFDVGRQDVPKMRETYVKNRAP
jgi:hypothetical protein